MRPRCDESSCYPSLGRSRHLLCLPFGYPRLSETSVLVSFWTSSDYYLVTSCLDLSMCSTQLVSAWSLSGPFWCGFTSARTVVSNGRGCHHRLSHKDSWLSGHCQRTPFAILSCQGTSDRSYASLRKHRGRQRLGLGLPHRSDPTFA